MRSLFQSPTSRVSAADGEQAVALNRYARSAQRRIAIQTPLRAAFHRHHESTPRDARSRLVRPSDTADCTDAADGPSLLAALCVRPEHSRRASRRLSDGHRISISRPPPTLRRTVTSRAHSTLLASPRSPGYNGARRVRSTWAPGVTRLTSPRRTQRQTWRQAPTYCSLLGHTPPSS